MPAGLIAVHVVHGGGQYGLGLAPATTGNESGVKSLSSSPRPFGCLGLALSVPVCLVVVV